MLRRGSGWLNLLAGVWIEAVVVWLCILRRWRLLRRWEKGRRREEDEGEARRTSWIVWWREEVLLMLRTMAQLRELKDARELVDVGSRPGCEQGSKRMKRKKRTTRRSRRRVYAPRREGEGL